MEKFRLVYAPAIRSVGELALAIYLAFRWHEAPTWLIYSVAFSFVLTAILSVMDSIKGRQELKLNDELNKFDKKLEQSLKTKLRQ